MQAAGALALAGAAEADTADAITAAVTGSLTLGATVNAISVLWGLTGVDGELILSGSLEALAASAAEAHPDPGQLAILAEVAAIAAEAVPTGGGGSLDITGTGAADTAEAVDASGGGSLALLGTAQADPADAQITAADGSLGLLATVTAVSLDPRFRQDGDTVYIYRPYRYRQEGSTVYIDYAEEDT